MLEAVPSRKVFSTTNVTCVPLASLISIGKSAYIVSPSLATNSACPSGHSCLEDSEGDALGDPVGESLGLSVGLPEGEALGLPVGLSEGYALGDPVGDSLGLPVGVPEGEALGDPVGLSLGAGLFVGASDGALLGK